MVRIRRSSTIPKQTHNLGYYAATVSRDLAGSEASSGGMLEYHDIKILIAIRT